jgi:hypothetical protein
VDTVVGNGWAGIKNGKLLRWMIRLYDALVCDGPRHRVPTQRLRIAFGIIVLRARSNRMRDLRPLVPSILAAVDTVEPGLVRRVGA